MNRVLNDLTKLEMDFIDIIYVQLKSFKECADLLNIDILVIRSLNNELDPVWRPISIIRGKLKNKKIGGNFWDFYYWYKTAKECCHYFGITKVELEKLYEIGLFNKRPTRRKTPEIDRKVANEKYENIGNLTYSCCWCNNAKTDTFSEDEFKIIGKAISKVWKQRLDNDNR